MRILISPLSKKELYIQLKKRYKAKSIKDLSKKMKIPVKTLDGWIYDKNRYIPKEQIKIK